MTQTAEYRLFYPNSVVILDAQREALVFVSTSRYAPGPAQGRSSFWPSILGCGCVLALIGLLWMAYKATSVLNTAAGDDNRNMASAMMMLSLADEKAIRDNATNITLADLVAGPAQFNGKWLVVESTVSWLQNPAGDPIQPAQAQPDELIVYWLEGPLAVMDVSKARPAPELDSTIRAYGRCIETPAERMGLSASGQKALAAMSGGNSENIAVFLAKWVEFP